MEININQYFENELCPSDFSASANEMGNNAGALTWAYSNEEVEDTILLVTFEQFAAFIAHMESMGMDFSDDDKPMNGTELNALFIQLISGDIRESEGLDQSPINWELYEEESREGQIASNIFLSDDDNVYYYLGE
jgi:hypothetical protein